MISCHLGTIIYRTYSIYCLVDILTATTSSILRNCDFPGPSHYRKENVEVAGNVQSLYLRKLKGELYILPQ